MTGSGTHVITRSSMLSPLNSPVTRRVHCGCGPSQTLVVNATTLTVRFSRPKYRSVTAALPDARPALMKPTGLVQIVSWRSPASTADCLTGWPCAFRFQRDVAVDKLREVLLALDREAGAAAARNVIPLNAHIIRFRGLAAEVGGEGSSSSPCAAGRLGRTADPDSPPASGSRDEGLHIARADRLVGGLQQVLGGGLVGVRRGVLRGRRHDHRRGCQKQDTRSCVASHRFSPTGIVPSGSRIELPMAGFGKLGLETICCFPGRTKVTGPPRCS